jgi:hypothetical protein
MKNFTQEEMDDFREQITRIGKGIAPKMKSSAFVLMPFMPDGPDIFLALQLGLCLLYEKPLIVLALKDAYIPPQVLALADAVVRGDSVEAAKAELEVAIRDLLARAERTQ